MATGEPQTSSAGKVRVERVIEAELAVVAVPGVRVGLVAPEDPVAQVEPEALAGLDVRVVQVELEALAGLEDRVVRAVQAALVVPENQVAPVGLAVRVAPVALANRVVPAELVGPVALANQVALAELAVRVALANRAALDLVPVVVAAQRRTRSATAAHHRGQARVREVEDLAAVAETTREPAAIEAEKAWAAEE